MKSKIQISVLILSFLLVQECFLFRSSNVPSWYKKDYKDPEYIYGKGRGTSQREELAIKKAETAAQSELHAKVDIELRKIIDQARKSDGIDTKNSKVKKYQSVKNKVLLEVQQMTRIKKKKILHNNSIYNAFFLFQLNKIELRELYLHTLKNN